LVGIAAFSAVNSMGAPIGLGSIPFVGLGLTWAVDSLGRLAQGEAAATIKVAAMLASLLIAGAFLAIGVLAARKRRGAFAAAIMFYSFDGFILVSAGNTVAVAFHTMVLYFIFRGHQACRQLELLANPAPASDEIAA